MATRSISSFTAVVCPGGSDTVAPKFRGEAELIDRCKFSAGQPLVTYPSLKSDCRPTDISARYNKLKYDLPDLPSEQTPFLVTATTPPLGTPEVKFAGLAASPLQAPDYALWCTSHSLVSVITTGIVTAKVFNLSRDSVYGGGIYAEATDENSQLRLVYSFEKKSGAIQKIGHLLQRLASNTAIIFVKQ